MPIDKSKFIEGFKTETREHLEKLNLGFLKLEKNPRDNTLLDELMREAHTIKGSATMMGYKRISEIAHHMEDGLESVLNQKAKLNKKHFDTLFKGIDAINALLEDKVTWEGKGITFPFVDNLCKKMEELFSKKAEVVASAVVEEDIEKAVPFVAPIQKEAITVGEESIRVDTKKLDKLMNLSGELVVSKLRLSALVNILSDKAYFRQDIDESLKSLFKDLENIKENFEQLTSEMEKHVVDIRMIPVSYLFNFFPRAMRDLALAKGKEIDFEVKGETTQLDKTIIEELKDPIMHLLRNSIDHGIENQNVRKTLNKPSAGKVTLSAYQQGSQVVIEVEDDGRGMEVEKIRSEALKKGLLNAEKSKELNRDQIIQLIFIPGFSAQEEVTDISGRGVGLDVVRDKIAKLKGQIEVVSEEGKGVKFVMRLPLTLAVNEILLVAAGRDEFAIPVDAVVETIRISLEDIKTVEAKEAINVRGQILPLLRLNDIFGLPSRGIFEKKYLPVVVLQAVEKKVALLVDDLIGRQDIISKPIGTPLKKLRDIAAATILGDGRVILILDIASIIDSAEGVIVRRPQLRSIASAVEKKRKTILLAEDALSTAMLEKNILESAGFSVVLAKDGEEALAKSKQEKFDLVISDVLMPRMGGFEFTSRLKKDILYKDIPVIIVTTRESDADKRLGLEAGASAYILKSEFTSEGLLEIIERLIG
jgi:chemotaxis protein histidine kinase CheA